MQLQVTRIVQRATRVNSFRTSSHGWPRAARVEPGAHPRITIPTLNKADPARAYSLVSDPADLTHYEIAVLLAEDGNGGSRFLHEEVGPGKLLEVTRPRSDFPFVRSAQNSILIAGGIGRRRPLPRRPAPKIIDSYEKPPTRPTPRQL
jgi:ferredoxin-NADP reductase